MRSLRQRHDLTRRSSEARASLQCSRYRESGACTECRRFSREKVEQAVLDCLRQHLAGPRLLIGYAEAYNAERARLASGKVRRRHERIRREAEIARELDRLIEGIAKGRLDASLVGPKMNEMHAER